MTVGFVMLCHTALDRAAQVARCWAGQGCPVVIHVDRKVPPGPFRRMKRELEGLENIRFSRRYTCEWGSWGIVAASQAASAQLLRDFPAVQHVWLASGACLPLRPASELNAWLAARPDTDFIESVTTEDVSWIVGGLSLERFTLHFPFSWRRQRGLFDAWVRLQRRLGIRRQIPAGLVPHLGSQWWCLTRRTLESILHAPERPAWDRYFQRVWIPDESYFQTLARRFSRRIESRSLTLFKFDFQGKPHIFYDDHLQLLRKSDCFVARKIWPHADRLYQTFLSPPAARPTPARPTPARPTPAEPDPGKIDRLFSRAVERRTKGRPGLFMQSRFPNWSWEGGLSAAPYSVFSGFDDLFEDFDIWLGRLAGTRVHGHLFAPERVEFAGDEPVYNGMLSDSAPMRNYNTYSFLASLIWNTRGERQCFQFGPRDNQWITSFMTHDPNAQISVISGAWAIPLMRSDAPFDMIRKEAARLQKVEAGYLATLRAAHVKARVRTWTLAEFIENPAEPLQTIIDEIAPRNRHRRLAEAPRMADLTGFGVFLQNLRNEGMKPVLMGDFPPDFPADLPPDALQPGPRGRGRPYLVK